MKKLKPTLILLALAVGILYPGGVARTAQTTNISAESASDPVSDPLSSLSVDPAPDWSYASGIVLVGLEPDATTGSLTNSAGIRAQISSHSGLEALRIVRLRVDPGQEQAALAVLRRTQGVRFAELDYMAHAIGLTPDDPYFPNQWYLEKIGAPDAWDVQTGSQDVIIALLDSGVQTDHPDLQSQLWTNPDEIPGNGIDDDANGKIDDLHGWHFYHTWYFGDPVPLEDENITDDFGHGTHVAGIAAAAGNNAIGIAGLAWGTRLMPVKVLDQYGSGLHSEIAAGIMYAADNGARVINLSLGGTDESQTLRDAIDYARTKGILVTAAAGNDGGPVLFPANYPPVLAVAATDANDLHPSYSNFGPQIDLAAPGSQIYSTWYRTNYFTRSGTSMAAPQVAAAAALLWSQQPGLSLVQIESLLLENTDDLGLPGKDDLFGYGRLNAHRSLVRLTDQPDLWLKLQAPLIVDEGQILDLTLWYGNRGNGVAQGVTITASLPAELQGLGATAWFIGDLPGNSETFTQTLKAQALQPGVLLTTRAEITTSGHETLLDDNQATADSLIRYRIGFPVIFVAPVSEQNE